MSPDFISYVEALYGGQGGQRYGGEAVSQLEHALQCATLAEADGASEPLIAASLLHDIGHLVGDTQIRPAPRSVDHHHEYRPIRMLRRHFEDTVLGPIRLHVMAKRYLCAVDQDYLQRLSPASRASLHLQGGPCTAIEAQRFLDEPFAQDALRLRNWDDSAKVCNQQTPGLDHFTPILSRCAQ